MKHLPTFSGIRFILVIPLYIYLLNYIFIFLSFSLACVVFFFFKWVSFSYLSLEGIIFLHPSVVHTVESISHTHNRTHSYDHFPFYLS